MKKIKCIKGTKYAVKNGDIFKEYELLKKIYSDSFLGTKRYSYTEVENLREADLVIIKHPITNCRYTLLANRFIEVKDNPVPSLESKEFKDFLGSQGMLGSDEHNKICYRLFKKAYEYFQNGVEANKEQPFLVKLTSLLKEEGFDKEAIDTSVFHVMHCGGIQHRKY